MMVIMKAFATNNNTPRTNVPTVISGFAISIPPPVSDAVDYSGGPEWNPDHLYDPDHNANPSKYQRVEHKENANAKSGVSTV